MYCTGGGRRVLYVTIDENTSEVLLYSSTVLLRNGALEEPGGKMKQAHHFVLGNCP